MEIAAQVSLYPLRQASLSPVIDEAPRTFRKHGLEVEPGVMISQIIGDDTAIFDAAEKCGPICGARVRPRHAVAYQPSLPGVQDERCASHTNQAEDYTLIQPKITPNGGRIRSDAVLYFV